MKILDRLHLYMRENNLTQAEAAKQIGIGIATINRLLNGVVTKNAVLIIEDFLEGQNIPEENPSKRLTQDDASADMHV